MDFARCGDVEVDPDVRREALDLAHEPPRLGDVERVPGPDEDVAAHVALLSAARRRRGGGRGGCLARSRRRLTSRSSARPAAPAATSMATYRSARRACAATDPEVRSTTAIRHSLSTPP